MNEEIQFCLRVDVDTYEGLTKGLPKIAQISRTLEIPITIYLSLGKYATGRNIFRLLKKKEFPSFKLPPWKRNSFRSLFRGTLLPAKHIKTREIELLRDLDKRENIRIHPHGYSHVNWAANFSTYDYNKSKKCLHLMKEEYWNIFEREPYANAAPNFSVNEHYFRIISDMKFKFSSDYIYNKPFLIEVEPLQENKKKTILQLPVTERTIQEFVLQGKSTEDIVNTLERRFEKIAENEINYVCFYVHAIFEPFKFPKLLEKISSLVYRHNMNPTTHDEYSKTIKDFQIISYNELRG